MGTESEDDFENLFEDLDLTSSKLGKTEDDKNALVVKIMAHLNEIDFELDNPDNDVLGDAYEYLMVSSLVGLVRRLESSIPHNR